MEKIVSQITGIDHIAIATDDLQKSLAFFEHTLGIKCLKIEDLPERGLKVAFLDAKSTKIELLSELHENSEISKFLQKKGPGIHHIAFTCPSLKEDFENLKKAGCTFTSPSLSSGADGKTVAFIHPKTTNGLLLELLC